MTKVEISPGPSLPTTFDAQIAQPSNSVPAAVPPVALVEIETAAQLIPGPVGPQGPVGPVGPVGPAGSPDTGADILGKLLPVDGASSGLDADLLDGQHGAWYLDWNNFTSKPATFPPGAHTHPESDITNLVPDLAAKAPLASPNLTGTPTAPTATQGTNSTQLATTSFVTVGLATKLDASAYTAADVMTKVKANDGAGSGVDADLLDGLDSTAFALVGSLSAYLLKTGGTMTGTLTLAGAPANPLEAATKAYVDAKPAGAVISDTPPASPSQGQTWWESDTGGFYISYNDGTSTQWVQVNGQSGGDVVGPAGATDNLIARFDGATGKLIQTSNASIDDSGNLAANGNISGSILYAGGGTASLGSGGVQLPGAASVVIGGTAAWVSQSYLKTTTNLQTTTALRLDTILTGQYWGFSPVFYGNANVLHLAAQAHPQNGATTYTTANSNLTSANNAYYTFGQGPTAGSSTAYIDQRYVQASPPYDMGDGEVPLFVFVLVNSDGTIRATSTAPDPVWAYNGPTRITPDDWEEDGTPFQWVRVADLTGLSMRDRVKALADAPLSKRVVDMALKNADMDVVPHPWISDASVASGEATPVLLDPMSPIVAQLAVLHHHRENGILVPDLIHKNDQPGDILIGNTMLPRKGPKGLLIVEPRWR